MSYERPSVEFIRALYEDTDARMSDLAAGGHNAAGGNDVPADRIIGA